MLHLILGALSYDDFFCKFVFFCAPLANVLVNVFVVIGPDGGLVAVNYRSLVVVRHRVHRAVCSGVKVS